MTAAETALPLAQKAGQLFAERGLENARLEAELLLAAVLEVKRLQLYTQFDRPITSEELERYRGFVRRRLKREPLQYIIGDVDFRTIRLRVDRRALIPRPETEVLVGEVLRWRRAEGAAVPGTVLDLCTGTGAIALALLAEDGFARAVATDLSPEALALAAENADALGLRDRVELRTGDLFGALIEPHRFGAIVANPPYIDPADSGVLAPEIREWEPPAALFADNGGRALIDRIVHGAPAFLAPGGLLAMEVGLGQAAPVAQSLQESEAYEGVRVVADLTGRPRIVVGVLCNAEQGRQA